MTSHKMPSRMTAKQISQTYNDGMVTIYDITDDAEAGHMPREMETVKYVLPFDEQRVGITRFYTAQQNHKSVEKVIRIQRVPGINNQQKARIHSGEAYRIDQVQTLEDVYPPSLDLTLVAVEAAEAAESGVEGSNHDGVG